MPVGVFFRARNTEATVGTLHDCRGGIEVDAARTMPLADPPKALLAPGHTPAILHLQTKTKHPQKAGGRASRLLSAPLLRIMTGRRISSPADLPVLLPVFDAPSHQQHRVVRHGGVAQVC